MQINKFTVEKAGERIDKVLSTVLECSRNKVQILIEDDLIIVNDAPTKANYKVRVGDVIEIIEAEPEAVDIKAENLNLDIIYQDSDVCVVNKPSGMVVHPSIGHYSGTLVNGLMYQIKDLSGINGELRPGIVHRIDKETSGLLLVAKNDFTHEDLVNQLVKKTVTRRYIAIVHGVIPHDLGKVSAPIGRSKEDRKLMDVVEGGKEAVTHFRVLERFRAHTLVECRLETGRTHQIRVHMKYIGFPLAGDPQYGRKKDDFTNGQFLHAKVLGFVHPRSKEYLEFQVEEPDYFQAKIADLREDAINNKKVD